MPGKNPVTVDCPQPEDTSVQIEVSLLVHTRRPIATTRAQNPATPILSAPARIPRITRLMALAIKFQDMVDLGDVRDFANLARLGHVTRARLTQIMNLLCSPQTCKSDSSFPTCSSKSVACEESSRLLNGGNRENVLHLH